MRIGYLTYGLDRAPTGIGRYAVELLRSLAELPGGPEIVLLTTEREDVAGLWGRFERHALPGCRLLPSLITVGNVALSYAITRLGLDLVHDPNGIAPFLGPACGARRVVTLHDAFAYLYPELHNRLDTWRYLRMLPAAARRADAVITVSATSRDDLVRFLALDGQKVRVIGEGVAPRFRPVPAGPQRDALLARYGLRPPFVLYVGALNGRKNVAGLLEAYALLRERRPGVSLVVGGQRQWRNTRMDKALQRLGLEGEVRFTGYMPEADMPALYSAAAMFVFPSLYEGFGLPPLEAMACGTPVVTSNVSSLPEVVGEAALTVDPHDSYGLARAIERLLDDQELRERQVRRGYEQARFFSWDRAARETLEVYHSCLAQAPARERRARAPRPAGPPQHNKDLHEL